MLRPLLKELMPFAWVIETLNAIYYAMIISGVVTALALIYRQMVRVGYAAGRVRLFILAVGVIAYPAGILSARAANMFYHPKSMWSVSYLFESLLHAKTYTFHSCLLLPTGMIVLLMAVMGFRIRTVCDIFFVHIPLAHAIGRIGCLGVGCCWGEPVTVCELGFSATFKNPVPLFAILVNLSIFYLLRAVFRRVYRECGNPRFSGMIVGLYLVLYGIGRFILEMYRTNPVIQWGLTQAQITMIVFVFAGVAVITFVLVLEWWKNHGSPDSVRQKNLARSRGILSFLCSRSRRGRPGAETRRCPMAV